MSDYRYNDAWKATVDRSGEEWRAYCEALSSVKRFLLTEARDGRDVARAQWQRHLQDTQARRGPKGIERLQHDFALIGVHEGQVLRESPEYRDARDKAFEELGCRSEPPPAYNWELAEQAA